MINKEYTRFEDLVLDDTFREYVEGSREDSVVFWNNWIQEHPDKGGELRKARIVMVTLLNKQKNTLHADKNIALKNLLTEIENQKSPFLKPDLYSLVAGIAAVVLLSAGLAWLWHAMSTNGFPSQQKEYFNEIIVPIGEKSQVILSDGTHVWINSGSRFKYPVNFGQASREVSLEGEAFFDVKKHGRSVFSVNTRDARIEVLGTAFDVKAYPEDLKTQTTVVRGLVKVKSLDNEIEPVVIRPDQMAVLHNIRGTEVHQLKAVTKSVVQKVNSNIITSWKDQMLVFADETFGDIAVKMERWYNMKILIGDNDLKMERYTGKFVHNETVYEVLEAIKLTTPIQYTVQNEEIVIKRKITGHQPSKK